MNIRIKPEQVYIIVFCFFAAGAGCKAVGEYALERFDAPAGSETVVNDPLAPEVSEAQFWVNEASEFPDMENLSGSPVQGMDMSRSQG